MTDSMRTRIADIIERVGYDWDAQMMSAVVDGKPEPSQPLADTAAQAIIDEFGMTVETVNRKPNGGLCSKHCLDEEHAKNSVTRVVGKWEQR